MHKSTNLLDELKAELPNATTAPKIPPNQPKRQTLDDAKTKVVLKVLRNKSDYVLPDGEDKAERIYKLDGRKNKLAVGLKCGNRWIDHKLIDGQSYIYVDTKAEVDQAIDMLIKWTEAGIFDAAIEEVMYNNGRVNKK